MKHVKGKIFQIRIVIGISGRYYGVYGGEGGGGCSLYDPAATCRCKGEARSALRFQGFSDTDA